MWRIGKTSLLNEFIKGKNALYLPAEEVNDSLNLKKFSGLSGEKLGRSPFPAYENWNDFFGTIFDSYPKQRVVIVIDEYPYANLFDEYETHLWVFTKKKWQDGTLTKYTCAEDLFNQVIDSSIRSLSFLFPCCSLADCGIS